MSRKLKRRQKSKNTEQKTVRDETGEKKPLKVRKRVKRLKYRKQRCAFVSDGKQCKKLAVGKSTLCKKHGGNPIIKDNLIKQEDHALIGLNSKFDPTIHPVMFMDLSRSGLSDIEIAAEFSVGINTLRAWAEKYEMFATAYEIGQALHEAWWLQQGKAGLNNRGFNTSLFKFLTSNKLGYSDKMETKSLNMNVHGVLVIPDQVSEEEWEKDEDIIDVNT